MSNYDFISYFLYFIIISISISISIIRDIHNQYNYRIDIDIDIIFKAVTYKGVLITKNSHQLRLTPIILGADLPVRSLS